MDRHRGMAQQRGQPDALHRRRVESGEGEGLGRRRDHAEQHQPAEEGAERGQHRRRPRHQLAQTVAREHQHAGGCERQDPGPEQQRAGLARPHRGQLVADGGRGRGVVRDQSHREVVAQKRDLERDHADRQQHGHRIDRPAGRVAIAAVAVAGDDRCPDRVQRAEEGAAETGGAERRDHCSMITWSGFCSASVGELGRALGDQAVPFADQGPVAQLAADDHLAPLAERVGHRARIGDRDLGRAALAVGDLEVQLLPGVRDRVVDDGAVDVVAGAGAGRHQLGRALGLAGGAERDIDERRRQDHGGAEGDAQPDLALAIWIHERAPVGRRRLSQGPALGPCPTGTIAAWRQTAA